MLARETKGFREQTSVRFRTTATGRELSSMTTSVPERTRAISEAKSLTASAFRDADYILSHNVIIHRDSSSLLTPEGRIYIASGTWDLLGSVAVTLVPGARHGPNVCRFVSSGWPRHESEANLSGLDLGTFGRRLAMGGCRVVRLAGIEDWEECVYGDDQAN